jgi:hypothetical protein
VQNIEKKNRHFAIFNISQLRNITQLRMGRGLPALRDCRFFVSHKRRGGVCPPCGVARPAGSARPAGQCDDIQAPNPGRGCPKHTNKRATRYGVAGSSYRKNPALRSACTGLSRGVRLRRTVTPQIRIRPVVGAKNFSPSQGFVQNHTA